MNCNDNEFFQVTGGSMHIFVFSIFYFLSFSHQAFVFTSQGQVSEDGKKAPG